MELKTKLEQRAKLIAEMQEMGKVVKAENRSFTAEETAKFDKLAGDESRMKEEIETLKRLETIENVPLLTKEDTVSRFNQPSVLDRQNSLRGWLTYGTDLYRDEYGVAAQRMGIKINSKNFDFRGTDTQVVGTAGLGGYTTAVDTSLMSSMQKALKAYSPIRNIATVINTADGNDLPLPTNDDTSNVSILLAENNEIVVKDTTIAQVVMKAYKFSAGLMKLSNELMTDSYINLEAYIGNLMGERDARGLNPYLATGTGSSQPKGFVAESSLGVTAAATAVITWPELVQLVYSLDSAYRANGSFVMHDSTRAALLSIEDDNGRPIYLPSLDGATPDKLLGYPVYSCNDVDTLAAAKKVVFFGDFSKYWIRDCGSFKLTRLNERFSEYDVTAFTGLQRHDGRKVCGGTPWKHIITHA